MCMLERYVEDFAKGYKHPFAEDKRINQWLTGTAKEKTPGYPLNSQEKFAAEETARIAALADEWHEKGSFCKGAPQPEPDLRGQAKF